METLFIYLIKASGLIGLFYLAYLLLLRKETFFNSNRWFLLAGLITSVVLPLVVFTKIIWVEPTPTTFDWSNIPMTTTTVENAAFEINWYLVFVLVYSTGILGFLIQFAFDFYSLYKVLKGKTIQQEDHFKFIDITENIAPFSFFNCIVYNSSLYSSDELQNILEHEKVHSQQKHSFDVVLSRLFCVFFWFNPLIWLYKKAIVQNLEFIADSGASMKISDKKAYQLTLLKITTQENCVTITNHFYQSLIKKRIIMLNQNQSKKWHSWKYITVFPALVCFVFLFQIEVIAQERETQKPENETKSETVDLKSFQLQKDLKTLSEEKEIIINGEKSSQEELDKLDPKEIEKIDVATISGKKTILVTTKQLLKPFKITDKTIYIDGVKSTKEEFEKLDKNSIDKMDVNTLDNTVKITTKTIAKLDDKNVSRTIENPDGTKPLIILNGQVNSSIKIEEIDPDKIHSINVLKGFQATSKYGESGKNGVLQITTKEKIGKNEFQSLKGKTVQGFQLLKQTNNSDDAINKFEFIITKNSTDEEIEKKCEQIKTLHNIDLTFFNLKRNSNGEIINIESNNSAFPRSYKQSQNPIEPFKFFYEKKANGGFTSGYARLSNSISRIIDNKNIDYKKAVIIIDGKQSDYKDLEKVNHEDVKRVITKDIKSKSSETKKYFELYGEKALYGFLIEIQTNDYNN